MARLAAVCACVPLRTMSSSNPSHLGICWSIVGIWLMQCLSLRRIMMSTQRIKASTPPQTLCFSLRFSMSYKISRTTFFIWSLVGFAFLMLLTCSISLSFSLFPSLSLIGFFRHVIDWVLDQLTESALAALDIICRSFPLPHRMGCHHRTSLRPLSSWANFTFSETESLLLFGVYAFAELTASSSVLKRGRASTIAEATGCSTSQAHLQILHLLVAARSSYVRILTACAPDSVSAALLSYRGLFLQLAGETASRLPTFHGTYVVFVGVFFSS
jgi:hypothetical protein